jgi:UPF0176 protein
MFQIFAFYKFKNFQYLKKKKVILQNKIIKNKIKGTIILSSEGINGTISGKIKNLNKMKILLKKTMKFKSFDSQNNSTSSFNPFHRGKIKIKKEVVPIGMKVSTIKNLDNYLSPIKWNKLLKEKNVKIIDTRKPFEYNVGTFKDSINPNIENFRNFPKYLKKVKKNNKIGIFCTGGIRCEKTSYYLKKKGFDNVYQLKGGILNYLQKMDKKESLWKGECYVFDNRISVKHELKQGTFSMCSGCRKPVSLKEKKSKKYVEGVSCPKCHDYLTESQKDRFAMRQKQILIAKKMGKKHIFQKEY